MFPLEAIDSPPQSTADGGEVPLDSTRLLTLSMGVAPSGSYETPRADKCRQATPERHECHSDLFAHFLPLFADADIKYLKTALRLSILRPGAFALARRGRQSDVVAVAAYLYQWRVVAG